jgi:hypothetical protein
MQVGWGTAPRGVSLDGRDSMDEGIYVPSDAIVKTICNNCNQVREVQFTEFDEVKCPSCDSGDVSVLTERRQ